METCDDCRQQYEGPAYYTFDPEECMTNVLDTGELVAFTVPHYKCTGNIGPCCGDELMPDDEDDPRRPWQNTYD